MREAYSRVVLFGGIPAAGKVQERLRVIIKARIAPVIASFFVEIIDQIAHLSVPWKTRQHREVSSEPPRAKPLHGLWGTYRHQLSTICIHFFILG